MKAKFEMDDAIRPIKRIKLTNVVNNCWLQTRRNKINKVLTLLVCMIVTSSGFAAPNRQEVMGPVFVVKRMTILNLEELLKSCEANDSDRPGIFQFKCEAKDKLSAPSDIYPASQRMVSKKRIQSLTPFRGELSVFVGGHGVSAVGSFTGSPTLTDMKSALSDLFKTNNLEGKKVEFYAHVILPSNDE